MAASRHSALPEESAEELYEHAPAGYVSSLPGGELMKINETLLGWTGYARDALIGRKRLQDLLAPGARIYYETHYAPLLQLQGSVSEIAAELLCADGGRLPVLMSSTLVRDDDGVPRVVRTTVFNASDRRRYERELLRARADAEARARAVLALAHVREGVLLVGTGGRVDVVNPAAEGILGLAAETAVGRPISEVVPEWHALVDLIPVGRPGDGRTFATVPLARGGHEQWLAVAGVDSGDGVVYTIRDVTADHHLEQLRSDLVAVVSHELRTPLTGAYGAAQTLLARYEQLADDSRRQLLELVVQQCERLTRILDQILLTSQLEAGQVPVALETFDAAALVRGLQASATAADRARLVVEVDAEIGTRGSADATRQILVSLVDNALRYSAGDVTVAVEAEDANVRFTVADHGPGVPAGERERIFERFYRLDPGQQRGVGGTGLGLYIAKQLATRMHGRIGLLPRDLGTTVFVDLPRAT
jgi:PAS domain S-box-containing protein